MYQSPPGSMFYESIQKYNKNKDHQLAMMYAFLTFPERLEKEYPNTVTRGYLCKNCGYGFSCEDISYRYFCPKCTKEKVETEKVSQ